MVCDSAGLGGRCHERVRKKHRCGEARTIFIGGSIMNREQFKGQWNQLKGELKKQWGRFTDDDLMEIEGDYDKFIGSLQERYGDQQEAVRVWVEHWYDSCETAKRGAVSKTP